MLNASNNNLRQPDLDIAKSVIVQEIKGLEALLDNIHYYLPQVIDALLTIRGKVVISGIGKSGHIARKIAGTLSSIGLPAIFLHPAEAGHGDLGVIAKDDIVILLSNSGESLELNTIINFCKRMEIKIIGISRTEGSTLDKVSDISVILPNVPEASHLNMPTTSSIMALAFGDAIAMVVKHRIGFSAEKYRMYHPSGRIGSRLLKIDDIMHRNEEVPLILQEELGIDAILIMTSHRLGCVGVLDHTGKIIGMITDGDLRRKIKTDFAKTKVEEVMTHNPITVESGSFAIEVLLLMEKKKINQIFIVNKNNEPLGVVHLHDLIRAGV